MKLIFLIDSTFSKRDYDRFGFDVLLKHKVDIQIWDFRELYLRKFENTKFETDMDFRNTLVKFRVFSSFNELEVNTFLDDVFVFDRRVRADNKYTTLWFKDKGAIVVALRQGMLPITVWIPPLMDQLLIIRNKFFRHGIKKLIVDIFKILFLHSNSKKEAHFNIRVCSGSASKCLKGEFEIRSHAFDYDIFLQENNKHNKHNKHNKYILFLDCGMTNHPDYQKLGIPSHCSDKVYFPLLRSFFDKVEKQTGLPVIVAIHPRIVADDCLSMQFGNRKLISNKTAQLVKYAKFVINHDSTAINFVALWRVPMIIITTNQIERAEYREMESQDQFLKTNRLNINKSYRNVDFLKVAQKPVPQYEQYVEGFIKKNGSPVCHSAEILIKGLQKYVQ